MLAARLLRFAGKVAQDLDGAGRLADALLERLALLSGQLAPNLGDAGFENVGGLVRMFARVIGELNRQLR